MIKITDLAYLLHAKVNRDFDDLLTELLDSTVVDVLGRIYEIADKGYILAYFEDFSSLSAEQIMGLLKLDNVLSSCYRVCRATKCGNPNKIKELIPLYADYLAKNPPKADEVGVTNENDL